MDWTGVSSCSIVPETGKASQTGLVEQAPKPSLAQLGNVSCRGLSGFTFILSLLRCARSEAPATEHSQPLCVIADWSFHD